jgi:hypothetical protein
MRKSRFTDSQIMGRSDGKQGILTDAGIRLLARKDYEALSMARIEARPAVLSTRCTRAFPTITHTSIE